MGMPEIADHRSLLDEIERMGGDGADVDAITRTGADGLRAQTALDQVFVMLRDDEADVLRMRCAALGDYERGQVHDALGGNLQSVAVPLNDGQMLDELFRCGALAEMDSIAEVAELARAISPNARVAGIAADAVRNQGIGYACVLPIATMDDVLGVLITARYGRQALAEEDSALLEAVAATLGAALARS